MACSMFPCAVAAREETTLPTVDIAGSDYYIYEVKKGDSLYGISNRYGWDIDKLSQLNPTQSGKLKKGSKIYFPVNADMPATAFNADGTQEFALPESYPVIRHIVKKGDSVYSIAKLYKVPVETIYDNNPETKSGLKRGAVVTIPQQAGEINDGATYFYYTIRPGDTLNDIAGTYNTSLEDMMRDNKGLSEYRFEVGDIIRVRVNSNKGKTMTSTASETHLDHLDSYQVDKQDTWASISDKTGVDEEELRKANPGTHLKKDATIAVPVTVTRDVERTVAYSDERELSAEGRHDIYRDVHSLAATDSVTGKNAMVSVALIIEDPKSKKDNEFTRGSFMALDNLKDSPYKINLKVLQCNIAGADSVRQKEELLQDLKDFDADLIVATYDSNFPSWLAEYGEDNGVEIVNTFDVKNEFYLDNPSMIHLLTPSSYFTEEVAEWVGSSLDNYRLITAGKTAADKNDAFANAIIKKFGEKNPKFTAIQDLAELKLDNESGSYLIYGYSTDQTDVAAMLRTVDQLKETYPVADIKVMGRPNWITFSDKLKDQFAKADVYFPSRFYFDPAGSAGKEFIADYSSDYGHGPIRSFPTYAAAGYEIMNYFIQALASNNGDFNVSLPEGDELQAPINLVRVGNWGGFYNPSAYIIRYTPFGDVEKILLKK